MKVLTLTGMGIPPYSIRGVTQTLTPIDSAKSARRTINGTLVDLSVSDFRKFASTIECTDMTSPALNGIYPGQILTVGCIVELAYAGSLPLSGNARTAVDGSAREADGFVFYRPSLTMMVMDYEVDRDEWGGDVGWHLDLEEV